MRDRRRPGGTAGLFARVALALGALVVALWLAGNLRSVERVDEASAATGRVAVDRGPPAEAERAAGLFKEARRFGPDAQLKVTEAGIVIVAQPERAAALLRDVVREEPDNAEAWVLIYALTDGRRDPAGARARRRAITLDPEAGPLLDRFDATR